MRPRHLLGLGGLIVFPLVTYAGYPALVWAVARLRPRTYSADRGHRPHVTFVIAAHNEASLIGAKVRDTLELDYPLSHLECIVVCDGCDDDTAASALAAGDSRLQVIEIPRHGGKLAAIRVAIPHARGEVIAFTDANSRLDRDALRHLVAPFADPAVVVVSGAKQVRDGPEAIYWRYERWIRTYESATGSIAGADGSLYAARADAVDASSRPGAADDLLISLRGARAGGRIVFAPGAKTTEAALPSAAGAFAARTRTTSGGLFALESLPELFHPRRGDLWWKLVGHKLLRIAAPPVMAAGAVALTAPLSRRPRRAWGGALGLALALVAAQAGSRLGPVWDLVRFAVLANLSAVVGLVRYIARRPIDAWSPVRGGDAGEQRSAQQSRN